MSERQGHGFKYERYIINKHNLTPTDSYTHSYDAYYGEIPVSIKTKKLNCNVEMADIFRNASIKEDFILIVGFWSGRKDNIVEEHILYIEKDLWLKQFPQKMMEKLKGTFDGISNDRSDDAKWKKRRKQLKSEWNEYNSNINVLFKRDHKSQKRIQCSIKKKWFNDVLVKNHSIKL